MHAKRNLGSKGEALAIAFLIEAGFTIEARNWRAGHKEIDIIARDGEDLVFIEVKTRRSTTFGFPEESISAKQIKAITRAACVYMRKAKPFRDIRFDVIAILMADGNTAIEHIRDAFS